MSSQAIRKFTLEKFRTVAKALSMCDHRDILSNHLVEDIYLPGIRHPGLLADDI